VAHRGVRTKIFTGEFSLEYFPIYRELFQ